MTMKRTSLHLDTKDLKALDRLAKLETQRTGSTVSASTIVRRLIREYLQKQKKPDAVSRINRPDLHPPAPDWLEDSKERKP